MAVFTDNLPDTPASQELSTLDVKAFFYLEGSLHIKIAASSAIRLESLDDENPIEVSLAATTQVIPVDAVLVANPPA